MEDQGTSPAMRIVSPLLQSLRLPALLVIGVLWLPISTPAASSISLTPDGTTLFVVNPDSGSVSAIDTASETKLDELVVGRDPRILALSPDGQRLYVTSQASATLTILDTQPLSVRTKLRVGPEPYGVVAAPNDHLVYVAASGADQIDVVDVELAQVVDTIPVQTRPKGLALSHDGTRLYVTHFLSGTVSVIDLTDRSVLEVISTGPESNMAQRLVLHPTNRTAPICPISGPMSAIRRRCLIPPCFPSSP